MEIICLNDFKFSYPIYEKCNNIDEKTTSIFKRLGYSGYHKNGVNYMNSLKLHTNLVQQLKCDLPGHLDEALTSVFILISEVSEKKWWSRPSPS